MHAERRQFLTWSGAIALFLGLAGRAGAQPAAPVGKGGIAPSVKAVEQSRSPMRHALVDNVVMLAELTVKPEKLEEFLDYTAANLKLSRSYPGNLAFDILINETEPGKVTFYEVWRSSKAQQDYMAWRTQAGDLTKLLSFLVGEPKFTALRSIA